MYTRFGLLTYRNITWFKQLTVHTNRKRESKFRCASKYHLPYSISVYESIYIKCNVRVSAMLIRVVFLNTGCTSNRFHDYSFTGETNNPVLSMTVSYLSSHRCGVFGMMPWKWKITKGEGNKKIMLLALFSWSAAWPVLMFAVNGLVVVGVEAFCCFNRRHIH